MSHQTNASGVYQVTVPYGDCESKTLLVDDFIPCVNGIPILARNTNPNEFWIPIIVKALAKLVGSYKVLMDGTADPGLLHAMRRACRIPSWVTTDRKDAGSAWYWHRWSSSVRCLVPPVEDAHAHETQLLTSSWLNFGFKLGRGAPSGCFKVKKQLIHRDLASRYTRGQALLTFYSPKKNRRGHLLEPALIFTPLDDATLHFQVTVTSRTEA